MTFYRRSLAAGAPPTIDSRLVWAGFFDGPGSEEYSWVFHSFMCFVGALKVDAACDLDKGCPVGRPCAQGFGQHQPTGCPLSVPLATAGGYRLRSTRLSYLTVCFFLNRRRNTPKSGHHRSNLLSVGVRVPCRISWAWFGPALGPNPARCRRFPAGSLKVFGALQAQSRGGLSS